MKCTFPATEQSVRLMDYAAGKLDISTAAEVETHVAACSDCAGLLARQRTVWQALETWEAPPVPMDFDCKLYQRIERRASWWQRLTAPVFHHALPLAAAAGVVLMAGLLLQRPPGAPPAETSAQVEALAPEQVQTALDDMDLIRDFNHVVRADEPRM